MTNNSKAAYERQLAQRAEERKVARRKALARQKRMATLRAKTKQTPIVECGGVRYRRMGKFFGDGEIEGILKKRGSASREGAMPFVLETRTFCFDLSGEGDDHIDIADAAKGGVGDVSRFSGSKKAWGLEKVEPLPRIPSWPLPGQAPQYLSNDADTLLREGDIILTMTGHGGCSWEGTPWEARGHNGALSFIRWTTRVYDREGHDVSHRLGDRGWLIARADPGADA